MSRSSVVWAVFRRNLLSYFSGVLGYLFIVVFVVAGAIAAFNPQFFANNLANLDQLNEWFPYLLLFLVPAITMGAWADERKSGTDELLFTLPAQDWEILAGKYLAVLAVYTVALVFSTIYTAVLAWIGSPDWGLLATTYFGYWLAGAGLLAAGVFASSLTRSATVAFVVGAAICAVPVFIGEVSQWGMSRWWGSLFTSLSLTERLRDFQIGIVPLAGVLYFVSLALLMLYLNLVVIGRRHWSGRRQANMGAQYAARIVSLVAILVSLNALASYGSARLDLTAEQVYTLTATTRDLVGRIDKDRPVLVRAFLSPEVPREYVPVRKQLTGLLRQYDRLGGSRLEVQVIDVEPFSEEAEQARHYGIQPRRAQSERGGRVQMEDIFLGAVIESSYDEVVVPFFDVGTPVEYELTRSIRTVSAEDRRTVGILRTDASITGGFDMTAFHNLPEWRIVRELKKQYNVEEITLPTQASPTEPSPEIEEWVTDEEGNRRRKYDVVLAVLPSTLTQTQLDAFVRYVRKGHPVLIFDDPMPIFAGMQHAPRQPKPSPGGMGGMFGGQQGPPKGDGGRLTSLLDALGLEWEYDQIAWDMAGATLHPEFGDVIRPEFVFVTPRSKGEWAFNPENAITSGLQELLMYFPGTVSEGTGTEFTPLLRTSRTSGLLAWDELIESGFLGMLTLNENPYYRSESRQHVLAARVTREEQGDDGGINAVFVADADLIADQMFQIQEQELYGLKIDNITFVLNAVDLLAGDEAYLALRKRREEHRTLEAVEEQTAALLAERNAQREEAEEEAKAELEKARERYQNQRDEIEKDESLSEVEKRQQVKLVEQTEERRLAAATKRIEREKQDSLDQARARTERSIRDIENRIRYAVVALSPLPAVILGAIVLGLIQYNERRGITPDRRVR